MGKMTPNSSHHPLREIRSFVRREGRMTPGQKRALEELWPCYGLEPGCRINPVRIFTRQAPLTLEIGFGNGESLATMATREPEMDFIGIEVHRPGVGRLLRELDKRALNNVRVFNEDAVKVLRDCLPDCCLDRLLLFFPDPWHKKRHHKRRIVQPDFIELVAQKLKPGGILHMATDWEDYAGHMLEVMEQSPNYRNCAGAGLYADKPGYRPVTKFERRGRKLGHGVWDLLFKRICEK